MSSAELPSLNINDLNFDTCERLRHLDGLLHQLGLQHGSRVLDVGGYPGVMARAFPHWNVVTVDTYPKGHPPYITGSGAALPFKDAAFDATIACDVLEHVPPQYREPFLKEISRVTASAVIVAGPYDTPGAAKAESLVRDLLPHSSPAQAWLKEHSECGLPSLQETKRALGKGAAGTAVVPAGSLTAWILFFAGQARGEASHVVGNALTTFIRNYNTVHDSTHPNMTQTGGPAYRHAVIAAMNAATALKLSSLEGTLQPDSDHAGSRNTLTDGYVDSLGALLKALLASEVASAPSQVESLDPLAAKYIERLEQMLNDRGRTVPAVATDSSVRLNSSITSRLARAWRALRSAAD